MSSAEEQPAVYRLDGFQAASSYLYIPEAEHLDPAHFWCFIKRNVPLPPRPGHNQN
jgi:hypothetical protein